MILAYLTQLVMSFFLGVSYVEQPDDKVFLNDSYYQDDIETVNYLSIYNKYNGGVFGSLNEECDLGNFMLDPNSSSKKIQDSKSNGYLFYTTSDTPDVNDLLTKDNKDSDLSAYIFKVPAGTKIIAPYNCTLDKNSLSSYVNMYPTDEEGKSMGSYIQVITEETDEGQFRITFGSIARHWCCLSKSKSFGNLDKDDPTTPYYKHTYEPDRDFKFNAGDVLAEAGQTGVVQSMRTNSTDCFIYVKVEKKVLGGSFIAVDIKELYKAK